MTQARKAVGVAVAGVPHGTTVDDAVRAALALDAMARSAETGTWVKIG